MQNESSMQEFAEAINRCFDIEKLRDQLVKIDQIEAELDGMFKLNNDIVGNTCAEMRKIVQNRMREIS